MGREVDRVGRGIMPLTFKPPGRSRERILSFGMEGSGKTVDALTIARLLPDVTFHWVDNDDSIDRLLETEFEDLGIGWENGEETGDEGNISLWRVENWNEHKDAFVWLFGDKATGAKPNVDTDDWIVLDNGSIPWDVVQDWASESVYDMTRDELTQEKADKARKADKKGLLVFDGTMDYTGTINPEYRRYLGSHLTHPPCHIYVTADVTQLDDRDQDKTTRSIYGKYGMKPRAQKRLGHSMQTVIMKDRNSSGAYRMTTVKDRGRGQLANQVVSELDEGGFAKDYLRGVAGWKPAKA